MCEACRIQARQRKVHARQARKEKGLCPGCGKPTETKVCMDCRERARQTYQTSKRKMLWQKATQLVFDARLRALEQRVPCTIGTWYLCDLLAEGDYDLDPHNTSATSPTLKLLDPKQGYIEGNVAVQPASN